MKYKETKLAIIHLVKVSWKTLQVDFRFFLFYRNLLKTHSNKNGVSNML